MIKILLIISALFLLTLVFLILALRLNARNRKEIKDLKESVAKLKESIKTEQNRSENVILKTNEVVHETSKKKKKLHSGCSASRATAATDIMSKLSGTDPDPAA